MASGPHLRGPDHSMFAAIQHMAWRPTRRLAWLLALLPSLALAQDALRGKRLYLDTDRLTGAGVSCVGCHGGLPGGAFGIGRAANAPAEIERAIDSVPAMAPLRGRMTTTDLADLAAFIGRPDVASPDLRIGLLAPAAASTAPARIDFGGVAAGARSAVATVTLSNLGGVPLRLTAAPAIVGANAADFRVAATDCTAGMLLTAQMSCRIDVQFQPLAAAGLRSAALRVEHDWVEGAAAVALLGTGAAAVTPADVGASGGGGALSPAEGRLLLLALLASAALRDRRHRRHLRATQRRDNTSGSSAL